MFWISAENRSFKRVCFLLQRFEEKLWAVFWSYSDGIKQQIEQRHAQTTSKRPLSVLRRSAHHCRFPVLAPLRGTAGLRSPEECFQRIPRIGS